MSKFILTHLWTEKKMTTKDYILERESNIHRKRLIYDYINTPFSFCNNFRLTIYTCIMVTTTRCGSTCPIALLSTSAHGTA